MYFSPEPGLSLSIIFLTQSVEGRGEFLFSHESDIFRYFADIKLKWLLNFGYLQKACLFNALLSPRMLDWCDQINATNGMKKTERKNVDGRNLEKENVGETFNLS